MDRDTQIKEIREAIDAGNLTLMYLNNAKNELSSASNFGIADLLGFDLIGGIGKHMKIDKAKQQMEMAKNQVIAFQRELKDVSAVVNFQVNISEFLTLADFFFDGLIADFWVQSKIGEAKNQIDNAIYQVNVIVSDLQRML